MESFKVHVIGPGRSGKSTLIQRIIRKQNPTIPHTTGKVFTLPTKVGNFEFFEIEATKNGSPMLNLGKSKSNPFWNCETHLIILCYDACETQNYDSFVSEWIPNFVGFDRPIIVVGTHVDKMANNPTSNTTLRQREQEIISKIPFIESNVNISCDSQSMVEQLTNEIFKAAVIPKSTLWNNTTKKWTPKALKVMKYLFTHFDLNGNQFLNDVELGAWGQRFFNISLNPSQLSSMKSKVNENMKIFHPEGPLFTENLKETTFDGFLALHTQMICGGNHQMIWALFKQFKIGYNLSLSQDPTPTSSPKVVKWNKLYKQVHFVLENPNVRFPKISALKATSDQVLEWTSTGIWFTNSLFATLDSDNDGFLTLRDLLVLFAVGNKKKWYSDLLTQYLSSLHQIENPSTTQKTPLEIFTSVKDTPEFASLDIHSRASMESLSDLLSSLPPCDYTSSTTMMRWTEEEFAATWLPWRSPFSMIWSASLHFDFEKKMLDVPCLSLRQFSSLWEAALALNPKRTMLGMWSLGFPIYSSLLNSTSILQPKILPMFKSLFSHSNPKSRENVSRMLSFDKEIFMTPFTAARSRAEDQKDYTVTRRIFQVFVLGAEKSGKTSLIRGFLAEDDTELTKYGPDLSKRPPLWRKGLTHACDNPETEEFPLYTVKHFVVSENEDYDEVDDSPDADCTVILRNVSHADMNHMLRSISFNSCDLMIAAYDSHNSRSFADIAPLPTHIKVEQMMIPVVFVGTKSDLGIIPLQMCRIQPKQLCSLLRLANPIIVGLQTGQTEDLYPTLVSALFQPIFAVPDATPDGSGAYSIRCSIMAAEEEANSELEMGENGELEGDDRGSGLLTKFVGTALFLMGGIGLYWFFTKPLPQSNVSKKK